MNNEPRPLLYSGLQVKEIDLFATLKESLRARRRVRPPLEDIHLGPDNALHAIQPVKRRRGS